MIIGHEGGDELGLPKAHPIDLGVGFAGCQMSDVTVPAMCGQTVPGIEGVRVRSGRVLSPGG